MTLEKKRCPTWHFNRWTEDPIVLLQSSDSTPSKVSLKMLGVKKAQVLVLRKVLCK